MNWWLASNSNFLIIIDISSVTLEKGRQNKFGIFYLNWFAFLSKIQQSLNWRSCLVYLFHCLTGVYISSKKHPPLINSFSIFHFFVGFFHWIGENYWVWRGNILFSEIEKSVLLKFHFKFYLGTSKICNCDSEKHTPLLFNWSPSYRKSKLAETKIELLNQRGITHQLQLFRDWRELC